MSVVGLRLGRPGAVASRRSIRVLEHDLLVFRRGWPNYLLSGLSQPFLYLVAMGIGLGLYVNKNGGTPGGVPYLVYIAPALLTTQAMMAAAFESAWPIMGKIEWDKTYHAALNTPLGALDLLAGEAAPAGPEVLIVQVSPRKTPLPEIERLAGRLGARAECLNLEPFWQPLENPDVAPLAGLLAGFATGGTP
jgi:hypothetical protein